MNYLKYQIPWMAGLWVTYALFGGKVALIAGVVVFIVGAVVIGARNQRQEPEPRSRREQIREAARAKADAEHQEHSERLAAKYGAELQDGETPLQAVRRHRREERQKTA